MLGWRVKRAYRCYKAMNIMSDPPVCIQLNDKVSRIVEILKKYAHNGFPVVDRISADGTPGHLCGLILRSQLVVIIYHRYFVVSWNCNSSYLKRLLCVNNFILFR